MSEAVSRRMAEQEARQILALGPSVGRPKGAGSTERPANDLFASDLPARQQVMLPAGGFLMGAGGVFAEHDDVLRIASHTVDPQPRVRLVQVADVELEGARRGETVEGEALDHLEQPEARLAVGSFLLT